MDQQHRFAPAALLAGEPGQFPAELLEQFPWQARFADLHAQAAAAHDRRRERA
jgi:hypothetical protein